MDYMDWINFGISVLSGLAVAIPAIVALVKFIQVAAKEKNWSKIMDLVIGYMETAEANIADGADRKEWVMSMMRTATEKINYVYDAEAELKVSQLIDQICSAAKQINKK